MSGPALELVAATKHLGPIVALDDVTLSVRRGRFVALLGLSGAGKTTLVNIVTGLIPADVGEVRVCGHDMRQEPVLALSRMGVVFQDSTLDLDLCIRSNLRFHAGLQGLPRREARGRIDQILWQFGLSPRAEHKARELTAGNRRRLELARALLHRPSLLLMDEPTMGLDAVGRRELLAHALRLRENDVGVLWATQRVDEAREADGVIILHHGRVLCAGSPAAVARQCGQADLADAFQALTEGAAEPPARLRIA